MLPIFIRVQAGTIIDQMINNGSDTSTEWIKKRHVEKEITHCGIGVTVLLSKLDKLQPMNSFVCQK